MADNKGIDNISLKLFVVLSRANRAIADRVQNDIESHGLNPTEFGVLELLFHKGDQPLQQIGAKLLLASGSITYVVDKLESKKLIVRIPCPTDRRITYASITSAGKALMESIFPHHVKEIEFIFSVLDQSEKELLVHMLKKIGYHADRM